MSASRKDKTITEIESKILLHHVFLSLGSNIDPEKNLKRVISLLFDNNQLIAVSSVWETPPVGTSGPNFLNAAAKILTPLNPESLKYDILRPIEAQLGRVRSSDKYAPRTIDLDIIIFDDKLLEPRLWSTAFLAVPMSELLPDFQNRTTGEKLKEIAQRLEEISQITLRPDIILKN